MKNVMLLAICAVIFCACNNPSSTSQNSQNLNYDLAENGCDTGSHSFGSTGDLCSALENNAMNNNCALSLREQEFQNDCPGQTFTPF